MVDYKVYASPTLANVEKLEYSWYAGSDSQEIDHEMEAHIF